MKAKWTSIPKRLRDDLICIEGFGPEAELLIHCARSSLEPERAARIAALAARPLDWNRLARLGERNRLKQLMFAHLKAIAAQAVPQELLAALEVDFRRTAARNLFLVTRLMNLLALFDSQGIDVIPYKGAVLAKMAYGDISLRNFRDLDLFVREGDSMRAANLLLERGYQASTPLTASQASMHLKLHSEYIFYRPETAELIELHWKWTDQYFCFLPQTVELWQRAERRSFAGRQILTFSPADQVLFLSAHGTQHCWDSLEWVCGISETIRTAPDIDWRALSARARQVGSIRMLHTALALVHGLLGRALPNEVTDRVYADRAALELARTAANGFFEEPFREVSQLRSYWYHVSSREQPRHKLEYLLRLALTPTLGDWSYAQLPAAVTFLYFPLRIVRLLLLTLTRLKRGTSRGNLF